MFRGCSFISPADPSLTSSNVLAALETVGVVEDILETPDPKKSQLKAQHANVRDRRVALVKYYLQTHPRASWEHLAGMCLWAEEESALSEMKKRVQPSEGIY